VFGTPGDGPGGGDGGSGARPEKPLTQLPRLQFVGPSVFDFSQHAAFDVGEESLPSHVNAAQVSCARQRAQHSPSVTLLLAALPPEP
tara:strand:- start:139 stop:399 length:261 start_codon:yes stop_codon:yes gene_type:complete